MWRRKEPSNGAAKSNNGRTRFAGLGAANTAAQLHELWKNQKTVRALQRRQQAKLLGIPSLEIDDDMLAGGDIIINPAKPISIAAWLIVGLLSSVLAALLFVGGLWWLSKLPPTTAKPNGKTNDYINVEVIPGP